MIPSRAVYDQRHAEIMVRVLGFHHDLAHAVDSPEGPGDWFCCVFHDLVPVLGRNGWSQAPPGSVMIHGPSDPVSHGIIGSWHRSWLRFESPVADLLLARCGLRTRICYPVDDPGLHDRWLLLIRDELEHPAADGQTLLDLVGCWWRGIARAGQSPEPTPAAVLAARRHIEQRYREDLDLDGLAAAVGLSRTHLCRGFRAAFATTPMRYVQRLRLQHASDLLRGSDLPVAIIAEHSGFNDIYYFSRAFTKERGCTPTAYRRGSG